MKLLTRGNHLSSFVQQKTYHMIWLTSASLALKDELTQKQAIRVVGLDPKPKRDQFPDLP